MILFALPNNVIFVNYFCCRCAKFLLLDHKNDNNLFIPARSSNLLTRSAIMTGVSRNCQLRDEILFAAFHPCHHVMWTRFLNGNWFQFLESRMIYFRLLRYINSIWGHHGAHLGPTGSRWDSCWPQELCYQGNKRLKLRFAAGSLCWKTIGKQWITAQGAKNLDISTYSYPKLDASLANLWWPLIQEPHSRTYKNAHIH